MKSCIFYLLKKLGNVVIRAYLCCPPLRQAVLVVLEKNLMGQGGGEGGLTLMSYCICIPRVLARVVVNIEVLFRSFVVNIFSDIISLTRLGSQLKI